MGYIQKVYNKEFSEKCINNVFNRVDRINNRLLGELELLKSDVVLDVGCNTGKLVRRIRPKCCEVYGIDVNSEAVGSSKVKNLMVMDARKTDFPESRFTKIVSSHTVEHVPNLRLLFKEMSRILKPNGIVVLNYPWELFKGMATLRVACNLYGKENPLRIYKKACSLHINRLNHGKIKKLAKNTGLKIVRKEFFFDPWPAYITILRKTV